MRSWVREDGSIDYAAYDRLLEEAGRQAEAKKRAEEAEHAAFHGRDRLNYGRVERRRGYRGHYVCLDCYYGKEWK